MLNYERVNFVDVSQARFQNLQKSGGPVASMAMRDGEPQYSEKYDEIWKNMMKYDELLV